VTSRRWDFISAHAGEFGVQRLCRVLRVSRSGYYRWIAGTDARAARQAADDALAAEIRGIHTGSGETYGVLRVHADLRGSGHHVNRKRVARLMRENGVVGRHPRRKKRTTVPDRVAPPVPDLLERDFTASRLDERWCGDITYIPVGSQWLFLACVIDIRSRRVLGWSMAPHMRAELVIDALRMAVAARGGDVAGVVFHSDRGSQYTSGGVRGRLRHPRDPAQHGPDRLQLRQRPRREPVAGPETRSHVQKAFSTMGQARLEIFRWLTYYNARRRHSALAYLSPMEFEQQHHATATLSLVA
jgi:transposase InsO family protein